VAMMTHPVDGIRASHPGESPYGLTRGIQPPAGMDAHERII
jgi:hypothetical protein